MSEAENTTKQADAFVGRDQLEALTESMKTVLADNERLRDRVIELEKRIEQVTALHNAAIDKAKQYRKNHRTFADG